MADRALIAMSGGVDSSVAAKLMKERGMDCAGATMRLYDYETVGIADMTCCSAKDVEDARAVAERLQMPYYIFHMEDGFREQVIDRFVRNYEAGRTPNPCIDCNRYLKFDGLFQKAAELGYDYVVTGHYATVEEKDGVYRLKRGVDRTKDQSYVLYDLTQEKLARTILPLGELSKEETRRIAREAGFVNSEKKDSQDICFVPDGDYAKVIEAYTGRKSIPGDFVSLDGTVMGRHKGIIHYTVGQRRGLGLSVPESVYVVRIDPEKNQVILGKDSDLYGKTLTASQFNWISGHAPAGEVRCTAKVRYRQKEQPAAAFALSEDTVRVEFDEPQRAITKGQSVVLYDGDYVLGGGIID